MATRLILTDEPDSGLWWWMGNAFCAVVDPYDFDREYDLRQTFGTGLQAAFSPGLIGDGLISDTDGALIYLVRDGKMKLIAGVYGVAGFRDGPGEQALFCQGGFQRSPYQYVQLPDKSFLVADSKNGKIRQLKENANKRWDVSTYYNLGSDSLALDPSGNLWWCDKFGSTLHKLSPSKVITDYASATNVNQVVALANGQLLLQTRNGTWDATYRFDPVTGETTRVCGMLQDEITAWELRTGLSAMQSLVDGDANGGAAFHTVQIGYANEDGTEIYLGSGDEVQVRRYLNGRVSSLYVDGVWREGSIRLTAPHPNTDPNLPLWVDAPGGKQANGYPWAFPMPWKPRGGWRWVQKIVSVDVPDNGGGGTVATPTNMKSVLSADGKSVTLSWDTVPGAMYDLRLDIASNNSTPGAVDGWYVAGSTDVIANGLTQSSYTAPVIPGNYTWWVHVNGGNPGFSNFTVPTQGGAMAKNVTVNWVTQDEAVPNAASADHFVVTLDGASANEPLTSKTHTFLNIASGAHSGTVACANAQGGLLAPAVSYTVTVPSDPTAPIPVSVTVILG